MKSTILSLVPGKIALSICQLLPLLLPFSLFLLRHDLHKVHKSQVLSEMSFDACVTITHKIENTAITLESSCDALTVNPPTSEQTLSAFCLHRLVLPVLILRVNRTVQYIFLCVCLLLLSMYFEFHLCFCPSLQFFPFYY